jgi:hypothetical protein
MRAQQEVFVRGVRGAAEGGADGEAAELFVGDVDRGERRVEIAGERDVVVAREGDVVRDAQPRYG